MSHANSRTERTRKVLQDWLRANASRWEKAAEQRPPDFENLDGMPDLPWDLSIGDALHFLQGVNVYDYPRPSVTVDVVVFGLNMSLPPPVLNVLLIQRGRPGTVFEGCWAIPGGFVDENEDLDVAARRELREETNAEPAYIEQLATFGKPGRDPRGHVVSVAYMALVRTESMAIQGGDDASLAAWWPVDQLPEMAFDHADILKVALARLRNKIRWQPVGIDLLPPVFALSDLQKVYETVLGRPLDKRNFRRKMLSYGVLEGAESVRIGTPGRRPKLFRFDRDAYNALQEEGLDFEL